MGTLAFVMMSKTQCDIHFKRGGRWIWARFSLPALGVSEEDSAMGPVELLGGMSRLASGPRFSKMGCSWNGKAPQKIGQRGWVTPGLGGPSLISIGEPGACRHVAGKASSKPEAVCDLHQIAALNSGLPRVFMDPEWIP